MTRSPSALSSSATMTPQSCGAGGSSYKRRRLDDPGTENDGSDVLTNADTEPSSQGEEAEAPAPSAAAAAQANEAPMPPAEAAPPADLAIPRQLEPPELATSVPNKPPTISEEIERLYNSGVFLMKKRRQGPRRNATSCSF